MQADEESINYRNYYGDNRKRHRIVFERGSYMGCVFCGGKADTREHVPSKVFLRKPFPTDLPTIPSCADCNNSYSSDELYTALLLELLKSEFYQKEYQLDSVTIKRLSERGEGEWVKQRISTVLPDELYLIKDESLERVLIKLATCHATHDVSDCYHGTEMQVYHLSYTFRPTMTQDEIDGMDAVEPLADKVLPEVGSMGYEHIHVLDIRCIQAITGEDISVKDAHGNNMLTSFAFIDWNDIQDKRYRYICFAEGSHIHVKIVIGEFLFAHIIFSPKDCI